MHPLSHRCARLLLEKYPRVLRRAVPCHYPSNVFRLLLRLEVLCGKKDTQAPLWFSCEQVYHFCWPASMPHLPVKKHFAILSARSFQEKIFRVFELQPKDDPPLADSGRAVPAKGCPSFGWYLYNMYTVYVLKSITNKKWYVGYTSKSADERLNEHLTGSNNWTRRNGPFTIVHVELFEDKTESIQREHFLKSGRGREWFDQNIPG